MTRKFKINSKKIRKFGLIVLLIFISSYTVNFFWESLHAVFLYQEHNVSAMNYVPMVSYVSLIDGFLVLGIYLFMAVLWRDAT